METQVWSRHDAEAKELKDKDKVWIEFDINVRGICREDISPFIENIAEQLRGDETTKCFFVPVQNKDSGVHLIYSPNMDFPEEMLAILEDRLFNLIEGGIEEPDESIWENEND